jgi:hypothetical protein
MIITFIFLLILFNFILFIIRKYSFFTNILFQISLITKGLRLQFYCEITNLLDYQHSIIMKVKHNHIFYD